MTVEPHSNPKFMLDNGAAHADYQPSLNVPAKSSLDLTPLPTPSSQPETIGPIARAGRQTLQRAQPQLLPSLLSVTQQLPCTAVVISVSPERGCIRGKTEATARAGRASYGPLLLSAAYNIRPTLLPANNAEHSFISFRLWSTAMPTPGDNVQPALPRHI